MNKIFKSIKQLEERKEDFGNWKAKQFSDYVCDLMVMDNEGEYNIKKEVKVKDRGDGRIGKVDVVFTDNNGKILGIEIDRQSPRKKSVFKLNQLDVDERYIILRSPVQIIKL
jgi:hypothetical protein